MFSDDQRESHIEKNNILIEELSIKIDALDRDVENLLNELEVSPEQLTTFLNDQNNFTPNNWSELLNQRKTLNEKLLRSLANIANPKKAKKSHTDRNIPSHWIFVR
ncbi:MAG: hypothetical protein WCG42_09590 [Parachlamydiaceae bacterium]